MRRLQALAEKIHFQIVLEKDGGLVSFDDIRESNDRGKPAPRVLLVADGGGRSGTMIKPFFCWDNTGYALGRDNKGKNQRAEEMFAGFRELHLSLRDQVGDDPGYEALCKFLKGWAPARAESLQKWAEAAGMNVVFKLRGAEQYVHQSEPVRRAWLKYVDSTATDELTTRGVSLISGDQEPLSRLHPLISGVAGANTMGAAIVSFNLDAFESYGKTQSYNSPVGVHDAFRYTTALNRLLSDERRRVRIGDATVVFWTDREAAKDAEELFAALFGEEVSKDDAPAESGRMADRLRAFLDRARQGRLDDTVSDPQAPFYILGLSPNASRLNVRFWLAGTVAQFVKRLAEHAAQLEIVGAREGDAPLVLRRLLTETAREPKDIPPQLAGELARAVLAGLPYPQTLFSTVVRRIRADGTVNHRRAAILKAYLIRNHNQGVPMAIDIDHPDEAYQLGRLFAALEKTQEDATDGKLNATIKDRYFGAASATPATVFPRLLRLHQHHMNQIESQGLRINREKLIGEICGRVRRFPPHLSLERQGLFYIGYYHQRQDFFTKKDNRTKETSDE
jgi:CRISPR-associated protein Csd1